MVNLKLPFAHKVISAVFASTAGSGELVGAVVVRRIDAMDEATAYVYYSVVAAHGACFCGSYDLSRKAALELLKRDSAATFR